MLGMIVHCTSIKNLEGKFNLELFKTLILNFAYIHSKHNSLVCLSSFRNANLFTQTK